MTNLEGRCIVYHSLLLVVEGILDNLLVYFVRIFSLVPRNGLLKIRKMKYENEF